jgi:hypothetical protein
MRPSYILDLQSDHTQILRIDCDAPMATEQTTERTTATEETTVYITSTDLPIRNSVTTNVFNCDDQSPHKVEAEGKYTLNI